VRRGVKRRQHEVTRERGLDGDLGRLEVADFAHQNDVRVLPRNDRSAAAKFRPMFSFTWT